MNELDTPSFPIDVAQVVCQYDGRCTTATATATVNGNFKRITLGLTRCGTKHTKAGFSVIAFGADYQRWASSGLFVSRSRAKRDPYEIATIRDIVLSFACQSMSSLPTSTPKSVSPCNWEALQFLSNSLRLSLAGRSGRTVGRVRGQSPLQQGAQKCGRGCRKSYS